jgi:acyl carrier protein
VTTDNVEGRVRTILAELFELDPNSIGPDTSTDTVEAWDSLQHLTVVLSVEEEFGIQLDEEQTIAMVTFPLITEIVREATAATGS